MKRRTVIIDEVDSREFFQKIREIFIEFQKKEDSPPDQRARLLSVKETAEYFRVSSRTINNWCRHKLLSPISIGRRKYFKEKEVLDLVDKNKTPKTIKNYKNS